MSLEIERVKINNSFQAYYVPFVTVIDWRRLALRSISIMNEA